jgi:allantoinase
MSLPEREPDHPASWILRSSRVVTSKAVEPAAIVIEGGVIAQVLDAGAPLPAALARLPVTDVGDRMVMPGLVDTHVHVNEPGRTEWEGYATATRAAAAGGITTLIDMPLNSIPATTTRQALEDKRAAAQGQCHIDVGFWGGVVPGNESELGAMVDAGVMGFKCFLVDSGVPEFGCVDRDQAGRALAMLGEAGVPLLVHAELPGPIEAAARTLGSADPRAYATYLLSRPPAAEEQAIAMMIDLCRRTGASVHIVHHSAASALPLVRAALDEGLSLSAETCPHYLHFAAEDIPDGATEFKCAPPIRERKNQGALWQALGEDVLAMVVSDHSPCTAGLKGKEAGDFLAAWGGVASLQLTLPVIWTEASGRGFGAGDLARWMCTRPAWLAGLHGRKGAIVPGHDADLVVWDPDREFTVQAAELAHKNKITPYQGERLRGVVEKTYVRGRLVHQGARGPGPSGAPPSAPSDAFSNSPSGQLLCRSTS